MTLIYAAASPSIGFMVSDTLSTGKLINQDEYCKEVISKEYHALKIHILNDKTAIAFAGSVKSALNIINQIYNELILISSLDVSKRILELCRQAPDDCEFLVLQLTNDKKKLAKITQNSLSYCERAYIGNHTTTNQKI